MYKRQAAGCALLAAGHAGRQGAGHRDAVRAYLRPVCPLQAGVLAATGGATAMLDVSDGLLRDAARLARASGVVVRLDEPEAAFPGDWAALAPVAKGLGVDPAVWVLTGGEDHGLLATFPPGAVPAPFQVVGEVSAPTEHGAGGRPRGRDGDPLGAGHQ